MSLTFLSSALRSTTTTTTTARASSCIHHFPKPRPQTFSTTSQRLAAATSPSSSAAANGSAITAGTATSAKPIGAFRGGIFGFLTGSLVTGLGLYYYTFEDYRSSNAGLSEDIYALQTATQHLNSYVLELEGMVDRIQSSPKN